MALAELAARAVPAELAELAGEEPGAQREAVVSAVPRELEARPVRVESAELAAAAYR